MSKIEIKQLFRINRWSESDISLLFLVLYFPVGTILVIVRILLILSLIILVQVLPESPVSLKFINKIACLALGISVIIENPKTKENVNIYVSNNVSTFDHIAIYNATGAISPTRKALDKFLCLNNFYFGNLSDTENFKKNVQKFLVEEKTPLYFTPEGKLTNGKAVLKFQTYPFQFTNKIQPVCITIERPFLDIAVTVLGSSYYNDIFYYLFCPTTNYKLKFLASLEKKCLSDDEFSGIVQQNMACALKVEAVSYTASELIEWEKRKLAENQQRSQIHSHVRLQNPELQRMTMQIREVLPHVPFNAIYNDLCTTRNVDNTITNILEGRVLYISEQSTSAIRNTNQPSTSSSSKTNGFQSDINNSRVSFNTAATSFPKSVAERSKSFQERKQQLIANARKRYIKKHNLNISF